MVSRDTCFVCDSADNYRRTGKHLTHEQWEQEQNETWERFNCRDSSGELKNPGCSCGKQNGWDDNYCSKCGKKL